MIHWHVQKYPYVWADPNEWETNMFLEKLSIDERKSLCLALINETAIKHKRAGTFKLGGTTINICQVQLGDNKDDDVKTLEDIRDKYFPGFNLNEKIPVLLPL